MNDSLAVPVESIAQSVLFLRKQRVILDSNLAQLYGVETRVFNQAVKRNMDRFPLDFMFQLTTEEFGNLKSQTVTSSWGGRRKLPYAFTEHGAVMAASILNSPRAVEVSVYVVRAFIKLREVLATHAELTQKIEELGVRLDAHDEEIALLVDAIRNLLASPESPQRKIGFRSESE